MSERRPKAPAGLDAAGRKLWSNVVSKYDLAPHELHVLGAACETADTVARLNAALAEVGSLVVEGSQGQQRPHPLLAEARLQRVALGQLLARLALPDVDAAGELPPEVVHARSWQARRVARARWG